MVMEGGENTGQEKQARKSSQKSPGGCQGDHHHGVGRVIY